MSAIRELSRKIIKKSLRVLGWTLGTLIFLLLVAYLILRTPGGQTWAAGKIANYLSGELKTTITVKGVDIEFFTYAVLEGVYIQDLHQDTLLNAGKIKVDMSGFSYSKQHLSVDDVVLQDAVVKLKKYKGERGLNFKFIVRYFDSGDTTKTDSGSPWDVNIGQVRLENCTVAYIDTRWDDNDRGMDFEDIRVTNIYTTFDEIYPKGDSVQITMHDLKAKEKCGFELLGMNTHVVASDTFIKLNDLSIVTPNSKIKGRIGFHYATFDEFEDEFEDKVIMHARFDTSQVHFKDLGYYAPDLMGIERFVTLSGEAHGRVIALRCEDLVIDYGKNTHIEGDFRFNGLPDIETTDMQFKIVEGYSSREDLMTIPVAPFKEGKTLEIPENIGYLGRFKVKGKFEGFVTDFIANAALQTDIGTVEADDVSMLLRESDGEYEYKGAVTLMEFNVGKYFAIDGMGAVSASGNISGFGLRQSTMQAAVSNGMATGVVFDGYRYSAITIDTAVLARNVFTGAFTMRDPAAVLQYDGTVDFRPKQAVVDFTAKIDSIRLDKIGYAKRGEVHKLSGVMDMNFTGSNVDDIDGTLLLRNINYLKKSKNYHVDDVVLSMGFDGSGARRIVLNSDIADATISGKFELLQLGQAFSDVMSGYLPETFHPVQPKKGVRKQPIPADFMWSVRFNRNSKSLESILPDLYIKPGTTLDGNFNQPNKRIDFNFASRQGIEYNGTQFNDFYFVMQPVQNRLELSGKINSIRISDSISIQKLNIKTTCGSDSINSFGQYVNSGSKRNEGQFGVLLRLDSGEIISGGIRNTELYLNDSLWRFNERNKFKIDGTTISFDQLLVTSGQQDISLNGVIAENPIDTLHVGLTNFNLSHLNYFTAADGLTLKGLVTGTSGLSNVYNTIEINSFNKFHQLYVNEQHIGNGEVKSSWSTMTQGIVLNGFFGRQASVHNIQFSGFYYPKRELDQLDIKVELTNIQLGMLQPLLKDFCSQVVGDVDGKIRVTGELKKPLFTGKLMAGMRKVNIDYLNVWIRAVKQEIIMEENSIYFPDFKITDEYGDTASVYGHLYHSNFTNFQFDFDLAFKNFMILNTKASDNELYYGRVFATGFMNIFGFVDRDIRIDINAKTALGGTKSVRTTPMRSVFNVPMTSTSEVGANEFISFIDKSVSTDSTENKSQLRSNLLELHLNVEITPAADVNVIFDETVGDEMQTSGTGNLKMDISQSGDFSIKGQYTLDKGKYLFTMKNVIFVPFELSKGGSIRWNGDPYQAIIDADAIYKTNASVEPFFPFDTTNPAFSRNYPVQVIMHLDSVLMNPNVGFSVVLPTADQNIREAVNAHMQTELERNRQVLSLMVLNSFMMPSEYRDGGSAQNNYFEGGSSTLLSNFVAGTLNNWLSQITTDVNVGVKYRPNDDLSPQELKLYMGTQLLNNKLIVDVNAGLFNPNSTSANSTGQFVGDFNAEYKVTDDGRVRLRAFNRFNDNTMLNASAPYTQGVAVMYKEEFNSSAELFARYKAYLLSSNPNRKAPKKNNKKQEPTPTPADTIPK